MKPQRQEARINNKALAIRSPAEPKNHSLSGQWPVPLKLKGRGSFSLLLSFGEATSVATH